MKRFAALCGNRRAAMEFVGGKASRVTGCERSRVKEHGKRPFASLLLRCDDVTDQLVF